MLVPTCTMHLRNTIFTMIISRDRSEPSDHEMHVLRKNRIETIRRQIRNNRNVHGTFKIRVLNLIVALSPGTHILTFAAWHCGQNDCVADCVAYIYIYSDSSFEFCVCVIAWENKLTSINQLGFE